MEEKKNSGKTGLVVIIVILLLIICGMGAFIFINKDKLTTNEEIKESTEEVKETTEEDNTKTDIFKDDKIKSNYYESKQEGNDKYILNIVKYTDTNGYFTLRYISAYETGSESPSIDGYYSEENDIIKLSYNPEILEAKTIFEKVGITIEKDEDNYNKVVLEKDGNNIKMNSIILYRVD